MGQINTPDPLAGKFPLKLLFILAAIYFPAKTFAQCTATLTVNTTSSCEDSTIVLTASPPGLYDYQWFINGQLGPLGIETWNYNTNNAGTYTFEVQITDLNNCTVISNPVTVTVHPNPWVDASSSAYTMCPGTSVQLSSSSTLGTTFYWTGPNGFTSTNQNPTIPNFQPSDVGQYSVIADFNGCNSWPDHVILDTLTSVVSMVAEANCWPGFNQMCEGDFLDLSSDVSGISQVTYSWTGPNGFTSSNQNPWINNTPVANTGVYTLTVTGSSCAGPVTLSDTAEITVYAAPYTSVSVNAPICEGGTLQFTTAGGGGTYSWNGPNGYTSTNLTPPPIPNVQQVNQGNYSLVATNGGCVMNEQFNVNVMSNTPTFAIYNNANNVKCIGNVAYIDVTNIQDLTNPTVSWSGPNFSSTNMINNYTIIDNSDSGVYVATVTGMGCLGITTITDSFTLSIHPCIWPGDVNNDMIANNLDVLDLGLAYGTMGPTRPGANYSWSGQYMPDWGVMQFCGQDMKFADCNGNGILTASDTFGIALNYGETHNKGIHVPQAKTTAWPDLYFDMSGIVLTPGATVSIPIKLGTSAVPMLNVYGLAAEVKITGVTPVNGIFISTPPGWMGDITNTLNFTKYINTGQTDWAYVRINQTNANGDGTIAMLQFEVPTGTDYQQVEMYFDNVKIIGNTGNVITDVNIVDGTATVYPVTVGGTTSIINNVAVVPNPSDAEAKLQLSVAQATSVQITITDISGRNIWNHTLSLTGGLHELQLPGNDLASGIYTIRVKDSNGGITRNLKWVKN